MRAAVVELIDLVSTEACVYLVMELVLGGHLQARLKQHGPYEESTARVLLSQVVDAVHHLHERNIIHRDIKVAFAVAACMHALAERVSPSPHIPSLSCAQPENILFAEGEGGAAESVKLTDFGLSTMKEGRLTTRCGTPSYCAPELLSGEGYGKAVDIWSLGVLMFVVLTGQLPFVGADRQDLFRRIQKGAYSYPGETLLNGGSASRRGACPPQDRGATHYGGVGVAATDAVGADGQMRRGDATSDLAKDLTSRLLKLEPMERYSTRETLQHPWFSGDEIEEAADLAEAGSDALATVHEMMRSFIAARRLKRAGFVVIACSRFRRAAGGRALTIMPTDTDRDVDDAVHGQAIHDDARGEAERGA